ncbi:MrcB family domain-containing protein [Streptomyces olivaceus]|uniref:MrcB family domain-containing protein n=1 Tax=Streptomyces olivaceus TaxID=47716 RepID=UPI0036E2A4EE
MGNGGRQRRDGTAKRVRLTSGDHAGPKEKKRRKPRTAQPDRAQAKSTAAQEWKKLFARLDEVKRRDAARAKSPRSAAKASRAGGTALSEAADTLRRVNDLLSKVLELQPSWTAANTDEMKARGVIIRQELPELLRMHGSALADALGTPPDNLGVEGRDATGLKTEIPWVRVFGREQSPRATTGWYVVYLFSAGGDRVYLSLNQGTTVWTGGDFKARKTEDLRARVGWARPILADQVAGRPELRDEIQLDATRPLGRGYGPGNVLAFEYSRDALPSQAVLIEDLLYMLGLLRTVYEAERLAPHIPGDPAPEVLEAERTAAIVAGRRTRRAARPMRSGQGFRLTAGERSAIERYSVAAATAYFEAQGWNVKDVGNRESFDLELKRGEELLRVEVKGTTSAGHDVILTRAEVEKQRRYYPANALVVVHSIVLDRTAADPVASGGVLHCTSPWEIADDDLTVISYAYRTAVGDGGESQSVQSAMNVLASGSRSAEPNESLTP